jgi:hypothetical protein
LDNTCAPAASLASRRMMICLQFSVDDAKSTKLFLAGSVVGLVLVPGEPHFVHPRHPKRDNFPFFLSLMVALCMLGFIVPRHHTVRCSVMALSWAIRAHVFFLLDPHCPVCFPFLLTLFFVQWSKHVLCPTAESLLRFSSRHR